MDSAYLADPALAEAEQVDPQLEQLAYAITDSGEDYEPKYDAWLYRTSKRSGRKRLVAPSNPGEDQMRSWAESDADLWSGVHEKDRQMLRLYRMTFANAFDDPNLDFKAQFSSPVGKIQIDQLSTMLGGMDRRFEMGGRTEEQQKNEEHKACAARYLLECWEEAHRRGGNGSLQHDIFWQLAVYGRVLALHMPDPQDPDWPEWLELLDPSTVYMTWGSDKYGPVRATRRVVATVSEILDAFDANGSKRLHSRLKKEDAKYDGMEEQDVLTQVWTRWYRWTEYGSLTIEKCQAHRLGRVPIDFVGHDGQFGGTAFPLAGAGRPTEREIQLGVAALEDTLDVRRYDLQHRFGRFLDSVAELIPLEEAIMSMVITKAQGEVSPARVIISPHTNRRSEPLDNRPGATNVLKPGENMVDLPFPQMTEAGAILGKVDQMIGMSTLPPEIFGIPGEAGGSGFQDNQLLASAKKSIQSYISDVEAFLSLVCTKSLYYFHGWGYQYVDNPDGAWTVPNYGSAQPDLMPPPPMPPIPGMPQFEPRDPYPAHFEITREMLEHCGFVVKCKLHTVDWRELSTIANTGLMLMQAGAWSSRRVMELTGVEDKVAEEWLVSRDKLRANQTYVEQVLIPTEIWNRSPEEFVQWMITQVLPLLMQQQPPNANATPTAPGGLPTGATAPAGPSQGSPMGIQSVQGDSQALMADAGVPGIPRMGMEPGMTPNGAAGGGYMPTPGGPQTGY